jgi:ubiquinone/menaquinone biosynthesis C-methylase UbiE
MDGIYHYPGERDKTTYDLENNIADPERRIEGFMRGFVPFQGAVVADIGAGGGYHATLFAREASQVFAIEPAPLMLGQLYRRVAESGLDNLSVLAAGAEDIPLRDGLVDIVHSRFAYFFGPQSDSVRSCEPGIREAMRILRPGGYFFVVDNAATSGQFAQFIARYAYIKGDPRDYQQRMDEFYEQLGFGHALVESTWTAPDTGALHRVMAMEFPAKAVEKIMSEVPGPEISYHYRVYYRQKEAGDG